MIIPSIFQSISNFFTSFKYSFSFINLIYIILKNDISTFNDKQLDNLKDRIIYNGPISLKFMQWYLSRIVLENDEGDYDRIINKFEDIFENCPFHSLEDSKKIFQEDFKMDMSEVIDIDSLQEIGSGSIGQVYQAKLIDGTQIALKIQHPSNGSITQGQLKIINCLIHLQKYNCIKKMLNLHVDIGDFMYNLLLQLDFTIEAFNTLRFSRNFKENELVIIPDLYYYSPRVLISKYENGCDYDELQAYHKIKVGMNFYCCLMQMNFFHDFTHGDLHKKNWKVRKEDGDKDYKIIFYDFGIVFTTHRIDKNIQLWESFQINDVDGIMDVLPYVLVTHDKKIPVIKEDTKKNIEAIFDYKFSSGMVINQLINILARDKLYINRVFLNILVIMTLCEKIFMEIDFVNRYDPPNLEKRLRNNAARYADVLAFVKKYDFYDNVQEYVEDKYNSYQIDNMFTNHNSQLEFDDPLDI